MELADILALAVLILIIIFGVSSILNRGKK